MRERFKELSDNKYLQDHRKDAASLIIKTYWHMEYDTIFLFVSFFFYSKLILN